jgi:cytoskeletal protein CcmA (bactofilin family)
VLLATLLASCTTSDTVATIGGDGSAGPGPACTGGTLPVLIDGAGSPVCAGELAARVFQRALCACQEITINDSLLADSFDSRDGAYRPGGVAGHVATNGKLESTGAVDVAGDLTVTGDPGIRVRPQLTVTGDLRTPGILDGVTTAATIGGSADIGGDVTLADLAVTGTLRVPAEATLAVSGTQSQGALERAPVDIAAPCPCDPADRLDVTGMVAAHAGANDNAAIGLDSATLSNFEVDTVLALPCGRFFLDRVQSNQGSLTVTVTGHAALFIGEAITRGRSRTSELASGAELDLFIADHINVAGDLRIGAPAEPARTRVYVGGAGGINLSAASVLAANVYAPLIDMSFSAGAEIFGAAFVGRIVASGAMRIHHDTSVHDAASTCPPTPQEGHPHPPDGASTTAGEPRARAR